MKKIYYLQKYEIKLGDIIEYNGIKALVTEELIKLNLELFIVKDTMQELLDKAKRDYPAGTVIKSVSGYKYTIAKNSSYTIGEHDRILIDGIYVYKDGRWAEILPLKFTTEDGVDIYGDMKTYMIHPNDNGDITSYHSLWKGDSVNKSYKYFYHKENALAYIKKCKEKTLKDYESILHANKKLLDYSSYYDGAAYNVSIGVFFHLLKANEPKLYYTKILQLIADDLNDGRYIHERGQASFHINKEGRITLHMGDDEGRVYFKSKELAFKARDIMGSKLEYLFN